MFGDHLGRLWERVDEREETATLIEVEPELARRSGCPACRRPWKASIALFGHKDEDAKRVTEVHMRQLTRSSVDKREVLGKKGSTEARIRVTVVAHLRRSVANICSLAYGPPTHS